ncbi:enoyl-CoA hydratase/isomerase family protein [Parasphingopyxis marina]|uniref:Enoyl-CoA hydratase/isomerase family protein n=1 Tax=Parasphingopyxis marina TaxID=2761622 RepID=A0A842I0F3_9SPHN|nr:enoyl-CoA hydratase-related protein [Parasphingopyxis marina]MBC2778966.1 enoyl-CoA hydratase/isomerase family protein [Parasphingopyxis marina]
MSGEREIRIERDGNVGVITLDRPDRLNAYTPDMGDELVDAFRALAGDAAIGAILLTGSGRAFCAGADRAFLDGERGRNGKRIGEEHFISDFAPELFAIPKPVIAAVNGPAVGIGATMLLPLDIRIAGKSALFGFPFARLGLMPGMGSTCLLSAIVGLSRAKEIFLTGATLDSAAALEAGLVSRVVADADLPAAANELARAVAGNDAAAMAEVKRAMAHSMAEELGRAIENEQREARALAQRRAAIRKDQVT